MNLPKADDLFSTQEERDNEKREYVKAIPLEKISDFPDHPFKVRMDEKMMEMIESVREYGVLSPAVVRPKEDGTYEMIAGHRRKLASQMADRSDMPCIVRNLTDEEATIIMVDSNLQREEILPSEKAFAYKMKLDAMKRQGQRTDLTSAPLAQKFHGTTSREILSKQVGESQDQIRRYIRLTELIKPILDMVDDKKIALRPAVELSYLSQDQQEMLLDTMQLQDCTPSHEKDIALTKKYTPVNREEFPPMEINGVTYTEKQEAGNAILAACKSMKSPDDIKVGVYRGMELYLRYNTIAQGFEMVMQGALRHCVSLGSDVYGNITRLDNKIDSFTDHMQNCKNRLSNLKNQMENAQKETEKEFSQEQELTEKSARLAELNALLDVGGKIDPVFMDEEPEEEMETRRESFAMVR